MALLVTGIALSVGLKIFEMVDKFYDRKFTNAIRNTCVKAKNSLVQGIKNLFTKKPSKNIVASLPNSSREIQVGLAAARTPIVSQENLAPSEIVEDSLVEDLDKREKTVEEFTPLQEFLINTSSNFFQFNCYRTPRVTTPEITNTATPTNEATSPIKVSA